MDRPRTFSHGDTRERGRGGEATVADLILGKVGELFAVPPDQAIRVIAAPMRSAERCAALGSSALPMQLSLRPSRSRPHTASLPFRRPCAACWQ